ncbi:MAG TPA: AMP-binding protein [Thermoanaerobaculia bacterium]|jgi:long-subunit acyl-CoA synthetase (AMP-forming)|nr:AMP-binding protein [Thermoanaerobaculia bacterium]
MPPQPQTVIEVLEETARRQGSRPALKVKRGGEWRSTSWTDYAAEVRRVAKGLVAVGLQPGQGVVIMGYNRPEWFIADLAAIAAGGVPTGIYTTSTPEQVRYISDHCDAAVAVVENRGYLATFLAIWPQLPKLQAVVLMEGESHEDRVRSWGWLRDLGGGVADADLDTRLAAQTPDDLCTLIYTSGTTGEPKGVMLSHRNIVWTADSLANAYDIGDDERVISYLPLSHIAEQMVSFHGAMARGACTWFAESLEQLGENLREVRPDVFFAVPRVWEKIQARMQALGAASPPLRKKLVAWARRVGLAAGYAEQGRGRAPWLQPLAKKLVHSKVRQRLGLDRAKVCVTSAAPISLDTLEFFLSLGIPIYEVYGMSECTGPATFSLPGRYRSGKAGYAIPGTEFASKGEQQEICMRGPHVFMGYYKNDAATKESLDAEGWLHSGDVGTIDDDGFLKVTDRIKELIVTSGGKKLAPQMIEGMLKAIPGIGQAVVLGDRKNYVAALLTVDPERLPGAAAQAGSPATTPAEAVACPRFRAFVDAQVEAVNKNLARFESVRRYALLPHQLTVEGGELTPTMKLKRRVIHQRYAAEIEALYEGAPAVAAVAG